MIFFNNAYNLVINKVNKIIFNISTDVLFVSFFFLRGDAEGGVNAQFKFHFFLLTKHLKIKNKPRTYNKINLGKHIKQETQATAPKIYWASLGCLLKFEWAHSYFLQYKNKEINYFEQGHRKTVQ